MHSRLYNRLLSLWNHGFKTQQFLGDVRKSLISFPQTVAFVVGLCLVFAVASCNSSNTPVASQTSSASPSASISPKAGVVRFGYQKSTILLKSKGLLEKRLEPEGVKVEWTEFPAGPQLLEALNVGAIDIGPVGESPPIFAQAAGANLVYVAAIAPSPKGSAVLVPKNSPLKTTADLKGKKVAFQKGSSANYLIVQVLEKAGLQFSDIQPIYLAPADARAAFVQGRIDAWVIWDPFYAAAEKGANAQVLVDGEGVTKQGGYYISSRKFATENAKVLKSILEEIRDLELWSDKHREDVAAILAPALKLDPEAVTIATQRRRFGLKPVTDDLIAEQQKVADTYTQLKLIPRRISIKEATLKPEEYAAFAIQ
jgi:sulfonate transport system substrate-binding protein